MTVNVSCDIGRYRVDDALRLLGPADFGSFAPAGCIDHLALVVKNIAIVVLRVFNYLCGNGEWYNNQMVESYCAIAKAEASSYPSKAEIHLQRAQYIAGRIENNENKARAYCALVEAQAGNSSTETKDLFAKAIEVVKLVEDYPNAKLLLRVAKAVASTMPEQASELVQQFLGMYPSRKDDWPRDFHICKILAPYSLMHLEQALALANGFENPFLKVRAFCQLAKLQVNRHSAHAEAICRQALDAAQQCCDEFEKNMALVKVVKVFASTNPDQACAVSELILERNKRARALYEIAKALARSNPERALEIAAGIQSPPRRTRAFLEVAKAQAITDPTLARRALQQGFAAYDLIDGRIFRRKNLYYSLVKVLALFDPEQARSKIAEVDQQPCRDKILCLVSQTEALTSVEKGVAIINSIEGVELKIKALCGIARPLVFAEPKKAKELFEKALAIASRCNTHLKYQRKLFSKIISALQD